MIPSNVSYITEGATRWIGQNYDIVKPSNGMIFGQYIDMQRGPGQNAYI